MEKRCVLDEGKRCVDCGECLMCDLDPTKLCDNCMRCVQKSKADYLAIEIDEVIASASLDGEATESKAEARTPKAAKAAVRAVRPKRPRNIAPRDSGKSS